MSQINELGINTAPSAKTLVKIKNVETIEKITTEILVNVNNIPHMLSESPVTIMGVAGGRGTGGTCPPTLFGRSGTQYHLSPPLFELFLLDRYWILN